MKRHVRLIMTTLIAAELIVMALTVGDAGGGDARDRVICAG
jgi:hypothetical protein